MLALEWPDLFYKQKRVNVDKNLGLIKNRHRKEGESKNIWNLGTPKSKNGTGLVTFNRKARYYMRELEKIQRHLGYENKKDIARTPQGKPLSKSTWMSLLK